MCWSGCVCSFWRIALVVLVVLVALVVFAGLVGFVVLLAEFRVGSDGTGRHGVTCMHLA